MAVHTAADARTAAPDAGLDDGATVVGDAEAEYEDDAAVDDAATQVAADDLTSLPLVAVYGHEGPETAYVTDYVDARITRGTPFGNPWRMPHGVPDDQPWRDRVVTAHREWLGRRSVPADAMRPEHLRRAPSDACPTTPDAQ